MHAEGLDGVSVKIPVGDVNCRDEPMFCIVEGFADCLIGD